MLPQGLKTPEAPKAQANSVNWFVLIELNFLKMSSFKALNVLHIPTIVDLIKLPVNITA